MTYVELSGRNWIPCQESEPNMKFHGLNNDQRIELLMNLIATAQLTRQSENTIVLDCGIKIHYYTSNFFKRVTVSGYGTIVHATELWQKLIRITGPSAAQAREAKLRRTKISKAKALRRTFYSSVEIEFFRWFGVNHKTCEPMKLYKSLLRKVKDAGLLGSHVDALKAVLKAHKTKGLERGVVWDSIIKFWK